MALTKRKEVEENVLPESAVNIVENPTNGSPQKEMSEPVEAVCLPPPGTILFINTSKIYKCYHDTSFK